MNRLIVIQNLVKQKKLDKYLEIGVCTGYIFFRIKTAFKVAVDPKFEFGSFNTWGKIFNFPYNLHNQYFEKTSDDFFEKDAAKVFGDTKPNLIFIDGMHEYQYALRDIENTLKYMPEGGAIIVHDCSPKSKESAASFEEWGKAGFKALWNGNVWKTIVHLRSLRTDINVFVLDCDHGLGVITKGKPENTLSFSMADIEKLTYEDMAANREKWLNLKKPEYFFEFFKIADNRSKTLRARVKKMLGR